MNHSVSYHVLSPDDLDRLITEASVPDRLLRESTALKLFDMSRNLFNELVKTGQITRHIIPGRENTFRYSEKQIRSIYKPLK